MKETKQFKKMAQKAAAAAFVDPDPKRSDEQQRLAKAFRAQAKILKKLESKSKKRK
jgi:hypothetical protein